VRIGYVAWCLAAAGYLLNFLAISIAFFGGNAKTTVATWCALPQHGSSLVLLRYDCCV
jgi:hypothetical protein